MDEEKSEKYEDLNWYSNPNQPNNAANAAYDHLKPRIDIVDHQAKKEQLETANNSNAHFCRLMFTIIFTGAVILVTIIVISAYFGTKFSPNQEKTCPEAISGTDLMVESDLEITWSDWGECSVPCGAPGTQQRTAPCPENNGTCLMTESRACQMGHCSECAYPLISGDVFNVTDAALTSSSYHKSDSTNPYLYYGPAHSRLNDCPPGRLACSWTAYSRTTGDWIQVDLGKRFRVTKIATQGRDHADVNEFLTTYKAGFSDDGRNFLLTQELNGNTDKTSIVENEIPVDVLARYVRVQVTGYNEFPSMRWEVYGCPMDNSN